MAKITTLGGVSHPEAEVVEPEVAVEAPDPTLAPVSTPGPSSPVSSEPDGEPEAAAEVVEPEVAVEAAEVAPVPAPRPKAAPSLSRAKDAPAEITGPE